MNTKISVQFLGGTAGHLTGSCTQITVTNGKETTKILVDAGLIQGKFQNNLEKNREILNILKPRDIDMVIISHPHVDHIGRLPLLVREGFRGRIICTADAAEIIPPMLMDSAKIQKLKTRRENEPITAKNTRKNRHWGGDYSNLWLGGYDHKKTKEKQAHGQSSTNPRPLYDETDVIRTCQLIKNNGYEYGGWIRLAKRISLKFYRSGHILGGAISVIRISGRDQDVHLVFSGDLGQPEGFILQPPELISEAVDFFFIEATYGGTDHPDREMEIFRLRCAIKAALERGGKVIIPSFVLERSQEMIYLLSFLIASGQLPETKIFLDSPLADKLTTIFSRAWEKGLFSDKYRLDFNPFSVATSPCLQIINSYKESEELRSIPESYIVIAGSGDGDAGRIREHLRVGLKNPDNLVCLVGYLSKHSLGRKLKDGATGVVMNRQEIAVAAQVASFNSFSAHADSSFLVKYTTDIIPDDDRHDRKIFVVHGGVDEAAALRQALINSLPVNGWDKNIIIPRLEEKVKLL